jgi:hypothetical protein
MMQQRLRAAGLVLFWLAVAEALSAGSGALQTIPGEFAEDLDGKPVDPIAMSRGALTVLVFIRTDCPISNRYAPEIQRLSQEFRKQAKFWLIYPEKAESASRIREHGEEFHYMMPALRDVHHSLVTRAQATITPEVAVFERSGKLIYHGRIDNWYEELGRSRAKPTTHELEDAIRKTVAGETISAAHANAVGCYISDLK